VVCVGGVEVQLGTWTLPLPHELAELQSHSSRYWSAFAVAG
jgi:hypothetical protein